jgi:TRAP transporter TAXI family solute receptor
MSNRKILKGLLVGVLVLSFLTIGLVNHSQAERKKGIIIGGCTPVGTWTLIAGVFAKLITKNYPGYSASPLGTAGCTGENIWRIHSREIEIALGGGSTDYFAYHGMPPFDQKMDIATFATLYDSPAHVIALKGRGIKTLEDLRGKRVSIGHPGTYTESWNSKTLFPALGMDVDKDIKADRSSLTDTLNKMRDGHVDAMIWIANAGHAALTDLMISRDCILVSFPEDLVEKFTKKDPFLVRAPIPAGTYKGQDEQILTPGVLIEFLIGRYMSDDFAYNITKIFFDNIEQLHKAHPIMKSVTREKSFERLNLTMPMHPGAARYYAEHGLKK